ncbi:FtsJ-domain-containing protein [Neoconidiobolus thromboides FSU 785]|nr:FtsJ-domain-containing protein [Neoconidiobolus thromboides FSU 785]
MGKTSKDKRDIFYRLAKEKGYRARSAFKLLQIDEEFDIIKDSKRVVDLCAAPGSWCQVLTKKMSGTEDKEAFPIIAVDLQAMAPLPNVLEIQGDITELQTATLILDKFKGQRADLVVCDGAPDVFNLHDMDEYIQAQLVLAALNITIHILRDGGSFIAKVFRGKNFPLLCKKLKIFFSDVTLCKPRASRNSRFVLCSGFKIPKDYCPTMQLPLLDECYDEINNMAGENVVTIPFVACGDRDGFDSDRTYPLPENGSNYQPLDPQQKPIEPPYKTFLELKRNNFFKQ